MMQRALMAAVLVVLVMCSIAAAEPKHVDDGWQRSDGIPIEIETPTNDMTKAETQEQQLSTSSPIYVAIVVGVVGLAALMVCRLWRKKR